MNKRVILVTGTPCTGKTTVAKRLTSKLDAFYINLTEFAKTHDLTIGKDETRKSIIIDEERMRAKLVESIETTEKNTIIVDGHYAAAVVPKSWVTRIFVLRRNPIELKKIMDKLGFSDIKLWENLASEILDVCLVEALQEYEREMVCELDITGKNVEVVVKEIQVVLDENKKCPVGHIDWLGTLETAGLLDNYLKV
jgi:adenylate kinase